MRFLRLLTRSLILLLIALFSALAAMRFAIHGREVRVPDLRGMTTLQAIDPGITGKGALGPVEAFGLDELQAGCEESGLEANVTVRAAD